MLMIAFVATACAGSDAATSQIATNDDSVEVGGTSPGSTILNAAAVATTIPVAAPTTVPPPTPISLPTVLPEFGPTGRPTAAGEVQVLTAKASVSRPVVYDEPEGKPIPVTYEYLNGTIDPTYDWFVNPTYFGNALAVMVLQGEPGDAWAEVQIPTRPTMRGWVNADDFTWSSSNYYVQVDVGTNQVKVWNGDEVVVDQVAVVTGDVGRETPVASTYIDEIMPESAIPIGMPG